MDYSFWHREPDDTGANRISACLSLLKLGRISEEEFNKAISKVNSEGGKS